ncbi:unnamed protein product [Lymnaea stagnalis]|uniref:5-formyltetrahydrofolate cyclo-ligase n=1 Tax=Lymnaea stagnalis TaxID=6523 RepID=A0AAV2IBN2_LYMST
MSLILQAKASLRQMIKQRINGLSSYEKDQQSKIIMNQVLSLEEFKKSQRISIYLSLKDEVNTLPILQYMFSSGKQCFIPHFENQEMIMIKLESYEAYEHLPVANSWGIKQPLVFDQSLDAIHSGGLDLIFMPGLAFTKDGARLGRGMGYYDKYLQKCEDNGKLPKTIALIFKEQLVDEVPTWQHDKSVDMVLFPTQQEIDELLKENL